MTKSKTLGKIDGEGLEISLILDASISEAFRAVSTREGIASWWTSSIKGQVGEGTEFELGFKGLDEIIRIRVDEAKVPSLVSWTILEHSGLPEWNDTMVRFALSSSGPNKTHLSFCHVGLVPMLECYSDCRSGWEHFLNSLASVAAGRTGSPFGG